MSLIANLLTFDRLPDRRPLWRAPGVSSPAAPGAHLGERLLEDVQPSSQGRVLDGERHQDAHDVVVGARADVDDAVLVELGAEGLGEVAGRLLGLGILDQLHGGHGPDAAHVADDRILLLQLAEAGADPVADHGGPLQQSLALDDVEHRQARAGSRWGCRRRWCRRRWDGRCP